jgi:hypothetical protein
MHRRVKKEKTEETSRKISHEVSRTAVLSSDLKINPRKFESGATVFKIVDFGLKSSTMVAGSFA